MAQGREIPVDAVGLVTIEMVDRQDVPRLEVVAVPTPLAPPVRRCLDAFGDLFPIGRVGAHNDTSKDQNNQLRFTRQCSVPHASSSHVP